AVGAHEGLSATFQVDDGEATETQSGMVVLLERLVIGATMRECFQHAPDTRGLLHAGRDDACNSTHGSARPPAPKRLFFLRHSSRTRPERPVAGPTRCAQRLSQEAGP